jgi:hypothetical protein
MSTFVDPPNPGSFEHNGQRPEVDESDLEEDSFDNRVADERRTLADGATDDDEPAPDERV